MLYSFIIEPITAFRKLMLTLVFFSCMCNNMHFLMEETLAKTFKIYILECTALNCYNRIVVITRPYTYCDIIYMKLAWNCIEYRTAKLNSNRVNLTESN